MADTVPTSGTGLTVFATPVVPASFDGFEYSAIAISYNNHDMEATLDVNAFDGQSSCFVITPAGNLLFSATDQYSQSSNLLDWLDQIASFGADDGMDSIRSDINAGQSGTTQFSTATNQYYLTYMPVGFQDWVMVGVVPSNVVNASMSEVQLLTIATVSVVLFALAALVVVILVQHGRRVLDQQVREVKYREQLFSALSGSTDNIFIMFSPDDGSMDYVSPNTQRILGIPAADIAKDVRNIDRSLEPGSISLLETNMHSLPSNDHRDGDSTRRHQETGELRWYHETLFRAKVGDTEKLVYVAVRPHEGDREPRTPAAGTGHCQAIEPVKEHVLGEDVPRHPHPHQRHHGYDADCARQRRRLGQDRRMPGHHPDLVATPAQPYQRRARHVQDRKRRHRAAGGMLRP